MRNEAIVLNVASPYLERCVKDKKCWWWVSLCECSKIDECCSLKAYVAIASCVCASRAYDKGYFSQATDVVSFEALQELCHYPARHLFFFHSEQKWAKKSCVKSVSYLNVDLNWSRLYAFVLHIRKSRDRAVDWVQDGYTREQSLRCASNLGNLVRFVYCGVSAKETAACWREHCDEVLELFLSSLLKTLRTSIWWNQFLIINSGLLSSVIVLLGRVLCSSISLMEDLLR